MKKIDIEKSDLFLAKSFLKEKDPNFVIELSLEMYVDYLAGLCTRFIRRDSNLENRLVELSLDQKRAINNYLNISGNDHDKIFLLKMKTFLLTLRKYYKEDGSRKG